ncbi:MAG: DNA polymerase I [Candidatus Omnitrophica bacterium]|nr:DNA polymerase I [Candidatus Omnitrophota bacterium]
MDGKRLYLIDATAFCYRAFYAIRGLATSFGQPTGAVYGFLNILNKILKEHKPEYLATCFDVSRDTFRLKKFAEYKIQRPAMPDELSSQIPLIKEIVINYGITLLEKTGYEAVDIIATFARLAEAEGIAVTIVSSDNDILQLVDKDITVFSPYKDEGALYDEKAVEKRFKIKPRQVADLIALMGDSADNIPSVPGIGEKTAIELIKQFGSVEKLLKNSGQIAKERIRQSVAENLEQIKLNKELVLLADDMEIDFDLKKLKIGKPNLTELSRIFKYLEFKKLLKDLGPVDQGVSEDIKLGEASENDLKKLIEKKEELFLSGDNSDNLIFYTQGKFLKVGKANLRFKEILSNPEIKKCGHDFKKMKVSLAKSKIILSGLSFDTMIAAYLLNPSLGDYGLENVSFEHLNKVIEGKTLDNAYSLSLIKELKPKLEKELNDKSLFKLFRDLEMPLVDVLAEMELAGIKLDLKVLKLLSEDVKMRLNTLIKDIYNLSGEEFNINSPKQLAVILFEKLKLPVVKKTKTGFSTDEEVLRKLADRHKLPELLLEYRQLTKLKTTYIDVLPQLADKDTGRIHTSFNQAATETGRLSSSNPNLQNIPIKTDIGRNIRRAIIAGSKDNWLISCDYSQIELRILAHLSKDESLIAAFKAENDIHKITAGLIYGLEASQVDNQMRERAKRVNFGIIYGLTSYGLSRDLNIPVTEAQNFIDAYFLRYPKVKTYIEEQIKKAAEEGFVTTILGRRRYIPEIKSKNQSIRQFAERQAVNTPIQGSASDLIKLAMIQISEAVKKKDLKSRMVLQIHDELLFDLPKEELVELVNLVRERMENVLKLDVPIKVDIKKGHNWLEMLACPAGRTAEGSQGGD